MKQENDSTRPLSQHPVFASKAATLGLVVLTSLGTGLVGGYLGWGIRENAEQQNQSVQRQIISSESELVAKLADEVGASVVSVNVTSQATLPTFFGDQSVASKSAGTGFIINSDGIVVTNRHVVPKGTTSVGLTLSDGTELDKVDVIGRTNESDSLDVAFLKITDKKGKTLKPVKFGNSSKTRVGDKVVAIGNALGQFQNTVTSGIISGHGRSIEAGGETSSEALQNLFQTDAAINPGNSGGPLVNMNGEVIAVNTAVAAGIAQNIGFAIPINDVQGSIRSVLKTGKLQRPYLGVRYVSLTDGYAEQFNLNTKRGAYLVSPQGQTAIIPGSPAEKAGLKDEDIIIKVNNTVVDDKNSLVTVLGQSDVGEKVSLTIIRDRKELKVDVTLEATPST